MPSLGPQKISNDLYQEIYNVLPIFCVDIIAVDERGRFLMAKRTNKPLKGEWGFPGGRVLKNETVEVAAMRKLKEETGLEGTYRGRVGFYELLNEEGVFEGSTVHTPVVVCRIDVDSKSPIVLDDQGSEFRWFESIDEGFHPKLKMVLKEAGF